MKYFHILDKTGRKTGTMAISQDKSHIYNISASLCSKKDSFCRKLGRDITRGRIERGSHHAWEFAVGRPDNFTFQAVMSVLSFDRGKVKRLHEHNEVIFQNVIERVGNEVV